MNLFKRTSLTKFVFFMVADIFLIASSFFLAFLIRFEGQIPAQYYIIIPRIIILAIIFTIPIFYFQKLYSFSWSYVSTSEIISLFKAVTASFLFLAVALYISKYIPYLRNFPRSVIFTSYILVFILCGGIRLAKRIYFQISGSYKIVGKEKTLIVGAGDTAEQVLRSILFSGSAPYSPVGFVDDNPIKKGVKIHGFKVLGKISDIPKIVKEHQVERLIIAIPSASSNLIKKAIELGREAGLYKIKVLSSLSGLIKGEDSLKNLRNVAVEDLLGREPISLDKKQIEDFIKNKAVLITGAAGSIGSELSRQVANFKPSLLILLDQDETGIFNIEAEIKNDFPHLKIQPLIADVCDQEKISRIVGEFEPKIIFHAAAYKHVPLMEVQPDQAVKNNIFGTENLIKASLRGKVEKLIFISTDKAVNPSSVMGATKRVGEMICQAYNQKNQTKFISVRFGNVLDSRGSVIPIFREQIRRKENITVTHPEMKRYFMLNSEACLLVLQAGTMGYGGEVFVLNMGEPVKILDLAKEMIKLSGYKPDKDIAIVFTGIRPGEKLFEEFLTAEEGTVATQNQKIFMAKLSKVNLKEMEESLNKLKNLARESNGKEIITFLKNITPYYR